MGAAIGYVRRTASSGKPLGCECDMSTAILFAALIVFALCLWGAEYRLRSGSGFAILGVVMFISGAYQLLAASALLAVLFILQGCGFLYIAGWRRKQRRTTAKGHRNA